MNDRENERKIKKKIFEKIVFGCLLYDDLWKEILKKKWI